LGRITSFHRGGGNSRRYRIVDFRRLLRFIPARILRFESDPFRTAPLILLCYLNGVLSYILAAKGIPVNTFIFSSYFAPITPRQ